MFPPPAPKLSFAATVSSQHQNLRAFSGLEWSPAPTRATRGGHRRKNGKLRSQKRRPRFQPALNAGSRRRRIRLSPLAQRRRPQSLFFASARKAVRSPHPGVWYHDSPRVLSVPKPTLPERIQILETGKICTTVLGRLLGRGFKILDCRLLWNSSLRKSEIYNLQSRITRTQCPARHS